jgi:hypothetical protein
VLFQPRHGPLMLFYKVGPHPAGWWGMLRTSSDNGKTWSEARRLPDKFQGPIKNKPVQLADGSILCPSSAEGLRPPPEWKIHFERTDEAAENWQHRSVPQPPGSPPAIQPSILHLGGNKLMALGRTKSGKVFSTSSDDSGTSWSAVTLLDLPNPNSGTDAVTLKDGRHLLVYNHTTKGRSPLNLAVSSDGKTWETALMIEDTPAELSYPAIIQAADGLVHITYTWKRQSVKHVVMDPSRLEAKPMRNGEWSNADGEPLRTTPPGSLSHAGIEPQPLVPGAKLFADRDYAAAGLPTALKNAHFLPIAMEGEKKLECKRAGTVFFLTPSRNRSADSNAQALLDQGFAKVALQEIPLFLPESTQNHCTLYQKDCAAAETIIIGKWAVPVFFP